MTTAELELLKYPNGRFLMPEEYTSEHLSLWKENLATFPSKLKARISNIKEEQFHWRYRPDGWTIKQVIHHIADSHMNALIRFKWTLTEERPLIKAYDQKAWAKLSDVSHIEVEASLAILTGVHARLVGLIDHFQPEDLQKSYLHPETNNYKSLALNMALYAWHGNHHLAHIQQAIDHKGEFNEGE